MDPAPERDRRRDESNDLLPADLRATLPRLYAQEKEKDPTVHAKFFTPDASWTWYVTEGQEENGDFLLFAYVVGHEREWGYVALSELESVQGPLGLPIERDLSFRAQPISEVLRSL